MYDNINPVFYKTVNRELKISWYEEKQSLQVINQR